MNQREETFEPMSRSWEREPSTFERAKKTAAEKLQQAAQALHNQSERGGNQELGQYGHRAADWLERTSEYVSDINPQQVKADLEKQVQRHPGRTLLIAGGIGLLLGAVLRRR